MTTATQPLPRRTAMLHILLGIIALVALVMSRVPSLAAYGNILTLVCATTGTTAVAIAHQYLPSWAVTVISAINPALLGASSDKPVQS